MDSGRLRRLTPALKTLGEQLSPQFLLPKNRRKEDTRLLIADRLRTYIYANEE